MTQAHLAAARRAARPWTVGSLFAFVLVLVVGLTPAAAATGTLARGGRVTSSFPVTDQVGRTDGGDRSPSTAMRPRRAPKPGAEASGSAPAGDRNAPRVAVGATPYRTSMPAQIIITADAMVGPARVTLGLGALFTTQFDGSPYANGNCNMAAGAMLFEVQTGRVTNGATLRRWSGARTRGTNLGDLRRAFRGQRQSVDTREDLPWRSFLREVKAGRSAVVQGWYGNLPDPLVLQAGYAGAHSVFVLGYSRHAMNKHGGFYVMDPLGSGAYDGAWWSRKTLRRFGWAGRPHTVGTGRQAFYGNVALQARPTYKRLSGRAYRPAFQSYWDTSKALLEHAQRVTIVPARSGHGPSMILHVRDPHLRLTPNRAQKRGLAWPLASWGRGRPYRVQNQKVVVPVGPSARVIAAATGRVVYRGWSIKGGQSLWIQHGRRLYTIYGGLARVRVEPGQWVREGKVLGRVARVVGRSGTRTRQLRFAVAVGHNPRSPSSRVNPIRFLQGGQRGID